MVSLAEVWRSYGIHPDAVVGHSQGEIAAACVAGALSLEDAARVVALRSQAITALAGAGTMASVPPLPWRRCGYAWPAGRIGSPSPPSTGPPPPSSPVTQDAVEELHCAVRGDGVRVRRIPVDFASHTPDVERIRDQILAALASITPKPATIPFYSTSPASPFDAAELDAGYWYRNLRQTVRFEGAIRTLLDEGHRFFIESSAHPVLTVPIQETIDDSGRTAAIVETLRRDDGGRRRLFTSLAYAHTHGLTVDWTRSSPARTGSTCPHTRSSTTRTGCLPLSTAGTSPRSA